MSPARGRRDAYERGEGNVMPMIDLEEANALPERFELPDLEDEGGLYASYGVEFGVQLDPESELADVVDSGDGESVTDEMTAMGLAQAAEIAMLLHDQDGPLSERVDRGAAGVG